MMKMNNIDHYVFDTSALLEYSENLFTDNIKVIIPSIVIEELDNLKNTKSQARKVLRKLQENEKLFEIIFYNQSMLSELTYDNPIESNDFKILATAVWINNHLYPDETVFVTNDYSLLILGRYYFGEDEIQKYKPEEDNYQGVEEIIMNDSALADFYNNPTINTCELLPNQYVIINKFIDKGKEEFVGAYCWTGKEYRMLKYHSFDSNMFGKVKPKSKDFYQACAFDSLLHNQITMLKGPAGSGKSTIAISYLMYLLERHDIDRILIFCNPVATLNSAKLGYYPGERDQKLLDSQIGNFLFSKLGEDITLKLIEQEKILLLPMSDIRGYDTSGMHAGIYITEAQNMDIALMKLALQRVGEDSIIILDGDSDTQVDSKAFEGLNNGMKRVSKVFRGEDIYGEVNLKFIHRSKIALIADKM